MWFLVEGVDSVSGIMESVGVMLADKPYIDNNDDNFGELCWVGVYTHEFRGCHAYDQGKNTPLSHPPHQLRLTIPYRPSVIYSIPTPTPGPPTNTNTNTKPASSATPTKPTNKLNMKSHVSSPSRSTYIPPRTAPLRTSRCQRGMTRFTQASGCAAPGGGAVCRCGGSGGWG